jgi:hypothetical protein
MPNLPQSDPKLKAAATEINAILENYGIAGCYCLASSTHAEFGLEFPDWSLIQRDRENGFRFRVKGSEYSNELIESSVHLAYSLRDMAGLHFQNFETICNLVATKLDIHHRPFSGLWDLDGWEKPDIGAAPAVVVDFGKRKRRGKGFGKGGNHAPNP